MAKAVNHAHAVYLEFHAEDGKGRVAQFIFVAAAAIGGQIVPYRMLCRQISPEKPQTAWRPEWKEGSVPDIRMDANGSGLLRIDNTTSAINMSVRDYTDTASGAVDAIAAFNWRAYQHPLTVQVSPLDIQDMKNYTKPKRLIERINRVRERAGWEDLPARAKAAA